MWFHAKGKLNLATEPEIYECLEDIEDVGAFEHWKRNDPNCDRSNWSFGNILSLDIFDDVQTKLQVGMKVNKDTDDLQLRASFLWTVAGGDETVNLSYDFCAIKMSLLDQNKDITFTRCVHLQSCSINFSRLQCAKKAGEDVTFGQFYNKSFCQLADAQKICQVSTLQYADKDGTQVERMEYIPMEVELMIHFETKFCVPDREQHEGTLLFMLKTNDLSIQDPPLKIMSPNSDFTDVVFKVGYDLREELTAHKCILAVHSPVLKAMLEHEMKEKVSGVIELKDVNREALSEFLDFIYGTSQGITCPPPMGRIRTYLDLLKIAHRFQVEPLVKRCVLGIVGKPNVRFTMQSSLDVYAAGVLYDIPDLKIRSLQSVKKLQAKFATPEGQNLMETFIQTHGPALYSFFMEIYRTIDSE